LVGDRRWLEALPLLRGLVEYCAGLYAGKGGIVRASVRQERAVK
jgi:hypothetical protein